MLTIFSLPKPFHGHIDVIQRNAIQSWTLLRPRPEIILFGDEPKTADVADELGVRHIADIARNEHGTPLVNDLFEKAQRAASYDYLCYVNSDIILMSDFPAAVNRVVQQREFLMVGLRWDIDVDERIDFSSPSWEADIKDRVRKHGKPYRCGVDCFVFPKRLYDQIPPFAIGRMFWDNWLIYYPLTSGVSVIDVTEVVTFVHQDHNHSSTLETVEKILREPESRSNFKLIGGLDNCFDISDANWRLTARGIEKPKLTPHLLLRRIKTSPERKPYTGFLLRPPRLLWHMLRHRKVLKMLKTD